MEQAQFKTAVRQLELKTTKSESDIAELKMLLHYYLRYPNLEKALLHHRACNLGTNDLLTNQKKMEEQVRNKNFTSKVCECCGLLINNEQLPYSTRLSMLNIGLGVHLFFKNYTFHILIFTLMFLIYSMFALITNIRIYNDTNATSTMCILATQGNGGCGISSIGAGSKVLNQTENANKLSVIQSWIGVGFVALWGLLYIIKTHTEQIFIYEMEEKRISASDFTLMLTHVPKQFLVDSQNQQNVDRNRKNDKIENKDKYAANQKPNELMLSQQDLKNKFNKLLIDYERKVVASTFSYEVIKVNVAKPLYDKDEQQKQKAESTKQGIDKRLNIFRNWILQRTKSQKFQIPHQKREQYYEQFIQYYIKVSESETQSVGLADENVVFVTLRSSQAIRQIQKRNKPPALSNFWNLCRQNDFPIKGVKVRKAPYPQQIKWNCIGFPLIRKRTRRFFMWMLTILLISISLGVSIGIAFINRDQINIGVSIGISIVVTFFNIGIQIVIVYTSYYQNEYISSREQSMIALKIGLGQIANSIGVPIIVTLISQAGTSMKQKTWLKSGGLVDDVFFIGLINILVPIVNFFDPWEQYLRVRRWWNNKPLDRLNIYGQKQFNKLYGNYNFDIGYEYAYLIKTSIFTSFFVCMQPIIALFAPIGLLLYYLSTKRNLLYHFQKPNFHFSTINNSVDFIQLISLPAFGLGCLLANNFIQRQNSGLSNGTLIANWIIFMIGVGFLIVVPLRIFYCCLKKPNPPQFDYIQKKMLLSTDYDRLNPQTKEAAINQFKTYLQQLEKKQQLPDEAKLMKVTISQQVHRDQQLRRSENNMMKTMVSQIRSSQHIIEPQYNTNLNEYQNIAQSFKEAVAEDNTSGVQIRNINFAERNNSNDHL